MPDVPHSTLAGDELHQPFHYVQAADPDTVGAGKWWLDTADAAAPVLKRRNAANTGWVVVADAAALAAAVAHVASTANPHAVTKAQVGLGNVPNVDATARANHTGTQSADTIVDGTTNKAYTDAERIKLDSIQWSATANASDVILLGRENHFGTQSLDTTTDSATRLAMTPAERTKLTGIAAGATANDTDANLRNRSTHTGTQSADTITDGTINKAYSAADEAKLAGVASGATANASDAYLLSRANHTGTQDAASIGSGVIAPERLGFGTPGPLTFLRGDGFWAEGGGGGGGEGGGFEPDLNRVALVDEFMGGAASSGSVGDLGWTVANGTVGYAAPPDATARGVIVLTSPATNGTLSRVFLTGYESFAADLDMTWRMRTGPTVSNMRLRVGLGNTWDDVPDTGIYVEKGFFDTEWFGICRLSGVQTRTVALGTAAANEWFELRMRKVGPLVIFNGNGGDNVVVETDVPTTGFGRHGAQVNPVTNEARSLFLDFFQCIATNVGR